jgi:hypothetical protein
MPLERPRHRWVDNIKVDVREWCGLDGLSLDRGQLWALAKTAMNVWVP